MNRANKRLIAMALGGTLTGISLVVLAASSGAQSFEGIVVKNVVVIDQLPKEVQSGTIRVKENDVDDAVLASQARITAAEAGRIATTAFLGKVIGAKMDNENGFLVWEVEVINQKGEDIYLKIDAGDGRLLASDMEDEKDDDEKQAGESKSSWWKFWEYDDDDGR